MSKIEQKQTPYFTALKQYMQEQNIPFDVPGHKMGRLDTEFKELVGDTLMQMDVNQPRGMDTLSHPLGSLKKAEALMADAFGADKAYFLVNGTTVGILTMIMAAVKAQEKIIMPRNVHKSAISALVISGAVPVFVEPHISDDLGIANAVSYENMKKAIEDNPDAKAVFIINPTYFGVTGDLVKMVKLAHEYNIAVLVDEAHGSHFQFSRKMPRSAMSAGADISSMSLHKTGGSLTQSSALLLKNHGRVPKSRIEAVLNMLQTTSPNAILMASLDVARKELYLHGREYINRAIELAEQARHRINRIKGLKAIKKVDLVNESNKDYDETKLIIKVNGLGMSGFDVFALLKDTYHIQLELSETYVVLAVIGIGTTQAHIDALISALQAISLQHYGKKPTYRVKKFNYGYPPMIVRPRVAYHAARKDMKITESIGQIARETIMIYPPGIPLVIPGELVTKEFVQMIQLYARLDSKIISEVGNKRISVIDQEKWEKRSDYDDAD
jgi:lysine decarboxylase